MGCSREVGIPPPNWQGKVGRAAGRVPRESEIAMTLVLTNEDVEALLTPRACIEPLDQAYREFALGQGANRARSHTYFPVESATHPRFNYRFKSQEGGSV